MIGRLLASAALMAALTGTAAAQMTAPPPSNPTASPGSNAATAAPKALNQKPASGPSMTGGGAQGSASTNPSGMSAARQTAQGHEQENGVAEKLNACEAKPIGERQACFDAATRM